MKKITVFLFSILLVAPLGNVYSQKQAAQTWVEKMQDPSVNFYEVQKAFNEYYQDSEPKFRKAEKLKEAERAKLPSAAKSAIPKKGAVDPILPVEIAKGKMSGGWKAYKRWENYMAPRLYPTGDRSVMINAWNEYLDNYYAGGTTPTLKAGGPSTPTTMAANWSIIGPTTTIPTGGGGAGRVNFVRFDPTASTTIYVGSPGGGLWKTTNSGTTWSTGTDQLAVIGTTDLAIHPTNPLIQYLATGDGEAQDTYSIGVLKTTDGGTTWAPTGLSWLITQGRTISRLLINPQNPNTVFAATSNGVYRTRNAGASWTQIATAVANMKDIEYRPGDTTVVYAVSGGTFYRSTNAGTTFATTSTGLPAAASCSRLSVAVTAANAAYVYVLASNTAYGYLGLYRSTDQGATFTTRSTTPNILGYSATGATAGGQGWYDLALAVSPLNADHVMVGGINIWRSTNGGTGWTLNAEWTGSGAPYVHADVHAIEYLPGSGTTYFAGCDGGLFRTTTSGTAWTDLSNGLQISQAYRIGLSATNANLLNTGWQDNGTARWNGGTSWSRPLGGDGMECIIDWSNANVQYGELYYGEVRKTTTGGNYTTSVVASGGTGVNADGDWVTPYVEAPSNAATLFIGKAQVYKSTNSGATWAQVGTISGGTGNVIALANAASNINYVYAAKIDRFYACTTGAAFVDRSAGLPTASAAISYIAIDPLNADRVWVTFSGYSAANKVWYSANAGVTWTNYSTGLPNLPANCIVYQGSSTNDPLYVGTDVGVYYRDNTSASWTAYNTGLPNVSVRELEIQYTAGKLRAATFGRSIWQSDLASPGTAPPVTDFSANRTNICIGDCINFTDLSAASPTSWAWSFTGGTPATSTLQNPTNICYSSPGTYQVVLTATNANGSDVETKVGYITVSSTIALPLVEGFQTATFVPTNWYANNPDGDVTWALSTAAGGFATSTQSAMMDNLTPATSIAGTVDEMLTPKYNFTGVSSATMTFDVAYCRYDATYFDSLIVFVSTNCGSTWSRVYAKGSSLLATAPDNNASVFVPTNTQWRTETVSMTPYAGQANVMVKFQNKSGWGQMLYLDNINITGVGAPVASVVIAQTAGTNPMCAGASATFTATPTNGGTAPTYQWYINGTPVGGATASTFTTSTLANGNVVTCVMTSNLSGVTGSPATSNAITMTVNALPATPTAANTGPYCVGGTISLTTPTVSGATYSWTGPSSYTSALQNPTIASATTAMAGTYSVTVTNASGCTSLPGTTTVVVNALPATPTASNTGPYCAGSTIVLSTPTGTGATYSWTGPASYTSTVQNPTRPSSTMAMAGTYSVTVTVGGCVSLAGTTTVVINALPPTPTATNTGPYCVGSTISLATPTVAGASYAWTGPGGYTSTTQNPTRPSATLAMAGTYSVTITVGGCTSLAGTTTVVVSSPPATPTVGSSSPDCIGATISLTSNTIAGATYSWTGPLAFTSSLEDPTIPSATAGMAGTYSLTVTVGGCTSGMATTTVVLNPSPAAPTAGSSSPDCVGSTISLASSTVAGATYSWSGPGGFTSTLEDPARPSATLAMAGTYSVTVTVGGCTSPVATTTVVVNAIPATPTVGSSTPDCVGQTISLTSNTIAGATYSWTGPASFTSTLEDPTRPSATTAMAGTYSLTVTVGGCTSATATTTVAVNPLPATPVPSINGSTTPAPICAGGTITLTTPSLGAGFTYSWAGPNSYTAAVRNPPALTGATTLMAGTYSLTVTNGGCTSLAGTVSIVVNPIPAAPTAGSNSPVCTGSSILLTSNTIAGATYSWTGPATFTSTLEDPTRPSSTLAMAGTYSVTVTVAGCTSVAGTTAVVVSGSVTPTNAIVASPSGAVCAGTSVTFTATAGGGGTTPTYQWQVNGVNAGTGGTTFSSSTLNNGDIVTCILTSSSSCATPTTATSNSITMIVNPNVVPDVNIVASPSGAVCAGTSVTFTATPTNGGSTPTYQWQVNGVNAGTGGTTFTTSTLLNGDAVTCIITSNATCASPLTATSSGITMTINPTVVPDVTVVANPSGAICYGDSVVFTATPVNGGGSPSYQWQVNGANAETGGASFSTSTLVNGDVVTCVITSSDACASPVTATSTGITMVVDPTPVTPTITVSGDTLTSSATSGNQWYLDGVLIAGATGQTHIYTVNGTYTVIATTGSCASAESAPQVVTNVGIQDLGNVFGFNIYPNPNDGNFNIYFNAAVKGTYTVELTNALGQLIFKDEVKDFNGAYTKKLSVVDYGKGVYTITLMNDKHDVVKKIIVY